jgi:HEPN domain-containing protein
MEGKQKKEVRAEYWLEIAKDDLDSAEVLFNGQRFIHMGFMCHQAIEKSLKAYYSQNKSAVAPFTHNLVVLAEESGIFVFLSEEQRKLLDQLQPLNIEARYPSYREKLAKDLSKDYSIDLLQRTKDFHLWLKNQSLK